MSGEDIAESLSSLSIDASSPPVDALSPPVDASSPPVDALSPPVDASSSPVDASSPPVDASSPPVDASSPPVDAAHHNKLLNTEIPCECADGELVRVRASLLLQSKVFADWWENCSVGAIEMKEDDSTTFNAKEVASPLFKKIVTWMEDHDGKPVPEIEEDPKTFERKWFTLTDFERKFFEIGLEETVALLNAGNFLNLQSLYRHAVQAVAGRIKDRPIEEIREMFRIKDEPLSEQEKATILAKNVWCHY